MRPSKAEVLEWERRWATPAAIAAFTSTLLVIAAVAIATSSIGNGGGEAALLHRVNQHEAAELISSILQALAVGLLAVPLYFLFRAARARSDRMRGQLVGVVIAAPIFLAVLAILSGVTAIHAANEFASTSLPKLLKGGASLDGEHAKKLATEAINNAPLRPLAAGFELGGKIGFVVAMFYTCLNAMRVGLLSRLWGSLGMGLGAISFIFFIPFIPLWFVYLGLLLLGRVPGGRPPAWAAGEAVPWPTKGEEAAAALSSGNGTAPGIDPDDVLPPPDTERRKRKQRD